MLDHPAASSTSGGPLAVPPTAVSQTAGRSSLVSGFAWFLMVPRTVVGMCRNITVLRGLEPAATPEEIQAAALQYVRKVTGVGSLSATTRGPIERAAAEVARITATLLEEMPDRRVPPQTIPPLRRPEVRARLGLD
jgi:hypothetical protein